MSSVTATAPTRLRLTRRGRAVLAACALVPALAFAAVFATAGADADASGTTTQSHFRYVTIQPGESLWTVATRVAPNADPRDVIAEIMTLNQLTSPTLDPGQRVAIPARYSR